MGRPANVIPGSSLELTIPVPLRAKLDLELYSDTEGRVPYGAYSKLFVELLAERYEHKTLDLSAYLNVQPGTFIVKGSQQTIDRLKQALDPNYV